jgi:hypothetical protein
MAKEPKPPGDDPDDDDGPFWLKLVAYGIWFGIGIVRVYYHIFTGR